MFSQILDEVELRAYSTGKSTVPFFLEAVLESKFPLPGEKIEVVVVSWKQPGQVSITSSYHRRKFMSIVPPLPPL